MTTITAHRPTITQPWTEQCFDLSPRQRRRAERSARRHQERRRRHESALHDDRYLDRPGVALSPLAAAMVWQR